VSVSTETKDLTAQVFLSYARKEQELADAIAEILSKRGVKVWNEQEVSEGADWAKEISKALEQSDSMIALLTPNSFSSSWVRKELEHAFFDDRYKQRLLPVLIGEKPEDFVRLPWILGRLQALRLKEGEPGGGQAKQVAEAFLDLLRSSGTTP
jgi:nucleotide-binding universal stress UspA family protein